MAEPTSSFELQNSMMAGPDWYVKRVESANVRTRIWIMIQLAEIAFDSDQLL
jgi:hypothetical protein